MALPFLDTNIFLRHLTQDHPDHSPRATAYLARIERGEIQARTTDLVIFETVYTLQRFYKQPKDKIRATLLPLINLPGIVLPGRRRLAQIFELYVTLNLPFADAYVAVETKRLGLTDIVSFDREFDKVPNISRIEP
jgi:uncharacterized protein